MTLHRYHSTNLSRGLQIGPRGTSGRGTGRRGLSGRGTSGRGLSGRSIVQAIAGLVGCEKVIINLQENQMYSLNQSNYRKSTLPISAKTIHVGMHFLKKKNKGNKLNLTLQCVHRLPTHLLTHERLRDI